MKAVDLSKPIRYRRTDPPFMRTTVRPKPRWLSRWLIRAAGLPFRLFPRDFEGWAGDTTTQMGVHATTHVDAPWHYGPTCGGQPAPTIDQIPLDGCIGPGAVFGMRHKADFEPITVADMEAGLAASSAVLTERTSALIRTGRDCYIEEPDYWKRGRYERGGNRVAARLRERSHRHYPLGLGCPAPRTGSPGQGRQ
jgi:Putative cyclase